MISSLIPQFYGPGAEYFCSLIEYLRINGRFFPPDVVREQVDNYDVFAASQDNAAATAETVDIAYKNVYGIGGHPKAKSGTEFLPQFPLVYELFNRTL